MEYAENFNLTDIVTPIDGDKLVRFLTEAKYDPEEIKFLGNGFKYGFDIGYSGPKIRQSTSDNIPLRVGSKTELWNKIIKEVKLGRVAGPFDQPPFQNYIQSPVGLVPKSGNKGQTRLIFHLSYDFGKEIGEKSLNHHTPSEICTVKYNDLDYAVEACLRVKASNCSEAKPKPREGAVLFDELAHYQQQEDYQIEDKQPVYLGKTDIKSAFHLLPLSIFCFCWLLMKALNPQTKKWQYFVDKCLPFGASISCALFQRFSNALKFLIEVKAKIPRTVTNYLDDFLFVAKSILRCNHIINMFLHMCSELGIPIAEDKTEWASMRIVFLGILIDGKFMILTVLEEKRWRAVKLLKTFIDKKKATVRDLQVLCGYLNFLNRAVHPGRTFVRRMYSKFGAIIPNNYGKNQYPRSINDSHGFKLKPHHHVRLDREFKADCQIWLTFLEDMERTTAGNGDCEYPSVVNRPMIDLNQFVTSTDIGFTSDASGNEILGYGCVLGSSWIYGQWKPGFIKRYEPSIEYLELFALCAGTLTWETSLTNCRIILHCDNKVVISMINKISSSCKHCMYLLRLLILNNLRFNRRLSAVYISSKMNKKADLLSRLKVKDFKQIAPEANAQPDVINKEIWPLSQLFEKSLQLK